MCNLRYLMVVVTVKIGEQSMLAAVTSCYFVLRRRRGAQPIKTHP